MPGHRPVGRAVGQDQAGVARDLAGKFGDDQERGPLLDRGVAGVDLDVGRDLDLVRRREAEGLRPDVAPEGAVVTTKIPYKPMGP